MIYLKESKHKYFFLIILVLLTFFLVAAVRPEKPACPTVVQMGEINIRIPAGERVGRSEQQPVRCAGMNVQVTGGSMLETPVIVNAIAHHDYLLVRVYLLEPQPGPMDVTVWWRVD